MLKLINRKASVPAGERKRRGGGNSGKWNPSSTKDARASWSKERPPLKLGLSGQGSDKKEPGEGKLNSCHISNLVAARSGEPEDGEKNVTCASS